MIPKQILGIIYSQRTFFWKSIEFPKKSLGCQLLLWTVRRFSFKLLVKQGTSHGVQFLNLDNLPMIHVKHHAKNKNKHCSVTCHNARVWFDQTRVPKIFGTISLLTLRGKLPIAIENPSFSW